MGGFPLRRKADYFDPKFTLCLPFFEEALILNLSERPPSSMGRFTPLSAPPCIKHLSPNSHAAASGVGNKIITFNVAPYIDRKALLF